MYLRATEWWLLMAWRSQVRQKNKNKIKNRRARMKKESFKLNVNAYLHRGG